MPTVRTRFAPSPTGYMHIGGMRTALFNWLWARHNNGAFLLRIDDTDRQRNVEEALEPILAAFRWLGLDWDEGPVVGGPHGPYFQSQRTQRYQEAAQRLLAAGRAFRDFDTPEQVRSDREAAEREKRPWVNVRRSLELSDAEVQAALAEGRPHVVRFLVPRDRKVVVDDHVRGRVEWDAGLIPDPVILRGDGSPLYNFATVVDDAEMGITHVIRAEEHLSNTPVQVLIHEALGGDLPEFAHIPFVTAPGTTRKLSKRDLGRYRNNPQFRKLFDKADQVFPKVGLEVSDTLNPVMVSYYEAIGFLPEAVLNGLARLGWSLDERTEILSLESVIESFTLDRVVKGAAGLDPDKLLSYQAHWMGQLSPEARAAGCLPYLAAAGLVRGAGPLEQPRGQVPGTAGAATGRPRSEEDEAAVHRSVTRLVEALGDRLVLFSDVLNFDEYFLADDEFPYDEKAFDKRLRPPGAAERLERFRGGLAAAEPFEPAVLEQATRGFAEAEGVKLAEIIHPVRIAVTGKPAGPGLFDAMALLGKERCLRRMDRALARLKRGGGGP